MNNNPLYNERWGKAWKNLEPLQKNVVRTRFGMPPQVVPAPRPSPRPQPRRVARAVGAIGVVFTVASIAQGGVPQNEEQWFDLFLTLTGTVIPVVGTLQITAQAINLTSDLIVDNLESQNRDRNALITLGMEISETFLRRYMQENPFVVRQMAGFDTSYDTEVAVECFRAFMSDANYMIIRERVGGVIVPPMYTDLMNQDTIPLPGAEPQLGPDQTRAYAAQNALRGALRVIADRALHACIERGIVRTAVNTPTPTPTMTPTMTPTPTVTPTPTITPTAAPTETPQPLNCACPVNAAERCVFVDDATSAESCGEMVCATSRADNDFPIYCQEREGGGTVAPTPTSVVDGFADGAAGGVEGGVEGGVPDGGVGGFADGSAGGADGGSAGGVVDQSNPVPTIFSGSKLPRTNDLDLRQH